MVWEIKGIVIWWSDLRLAMFIHVDTLSHEGKIVFTNSSKYVNTPMEVAHGGGIFRSATVTIWLGR